LWALGLGLIGFVLWAILVPLDEGVPSPGTVSIDTKRRTIQHLQGGIVKELLVKEGDVVEEGQLLLQLDDAVVRADYENALQNLAVFQENVIAQRAVLNGLREAEKSRMAQLELLKQAELSRLSQLDLTDRERKGIRELVEEGFAPMVQQLQLERTMAEIQSSVIETQRLQAEILSTVSDLRTNQLRSEQTLLELNHQIRASEQRLVAAEDQLGRLAIRANAKGQVVGLAIPTVGAVLQPTQRIMDIVPQGERLTIEAQIAPQYIDQVKQSDPVDVRFSNFAGDPQLVVEGTVLTISQDVLTDQATGLSYYLARISLTEEGEKTLGSRSMQPGMPVEVIIKTGSRTLFSYLVSPLTRRLATSLNEN
jgi:protease secretion system membrane fusion protein